jgi:hypothetical protein
MNIDTVVHDAFKIIHDSNPEIINFIDVGVYHGMFLDKIHRFLNSKPLYSVGIEPNNSLNSLSKYTASFNCAIDNVDEPTHLPFTFNADCDACSSLLPMNTEEITNDRKYFDTKWYCPSPITNILKVESVLVDSMSNILDKLDHFKTNKIHYLKIDAEGVDIRVVKSMKNYLKKTMFVQIETYVSTNKSVKLYQGQTHIDEDIDTMKSLGFELFGMVDYSSNSSPNADVVFINTRKEL